MQVINPSHSMLADGTWAKLTFSAEQILTPNDVTNDIQMAVDILASDLYARRKQRPVIPPYMSVEMSFMQIHS